MAEAALEGWLDRAVLRSLPEAEALARLQSLPGVGPFFASGILYRGAGLVDCTVENPATLDAIAQAYGPGARLKELSEIWRPYRMWATVLLNVEYRSS